MTSSFPASACNTALLKYGYRKVELSGAQVTTHLVVNILTHRKLVEKCNREPNTRSQFPALVGNDAQTMHKRTFVEDATQTSIRFALGI